MGFIQFLEDRFAKTKPVPVTDPHHNPYAEKLIHTVTVVIDGLETDLELREIRNRQAQVMGAQSTFTYRGEKIPILTSAPQAQTFSAGIDIALPIEIMDEFRAELKRLKDEGSVSPAAKLSYNPETKNAILFRRAEKETSGKLMKWREACDANLQTLIDDFVACMPYIMGVYGE